MNDRIASRPRDTLEAARLINEWAEEYSFEQMTTDRLIESAFILQFERIGETLRIVRDIDPWFEKHLPDINQWIGLRHRLVHDYREIDFDLIWLSATREIPILIERLESILRAGRNGSLNPG